MINYSYIQDSITFYQEKGFKRIESPWAVTKEISDITKPKDVPDTFRLNHNGKILVASGEQSFLYLYVKGFLPKGKFQTVTPCFRYDSFDEFHTKYFIKNELIQTDKVDRENLMAMIADAHELFKSFGIKTDIKKTDIGYDLEYKGVELGSYGIRECSFLKWIYGTGLAEPRLTMVKQKFNL